MARKSNAEVMQNMRVNEFVDNYITANRDHVYAYELTFGRKDKTKADKYIQNNLVVNAIIKKTTELMGATEGIDRAWILKELKWLYTQTRDKMLSQRTALDCLKTIAQMIGAMQPAQQNIQINNINTNQDQLPLLEIKFINQNNQIDATDAEIIEGDTDQPKAE